MPRATLFVLVLILTLTGAAAEDVSVLVSSVAGARAYDPAVGAGYVVLPAPHADLNVNWNAATQTFSGGFRTDSDSSGGGAFVQFGPEDAIAYLPATGQRERTSNASQNNFQGALGDTYWVFPSNATLSNNAYTLYLGLTAYGVAYDGTFTDNRIRWTVHAVENLTTPAANAFYGYSVSAGPTVNMQLTADPAYPAAQMTLLANGHTHLNLLFKAAGLYRVTLRVRGTLAATGQEVSSLVPVYFGVEEWQIPATTMSYENWRMAEFTDQQAADALVSGPGADPDGDGFTNLQEFAFGGDPLVPDADLIRPRLERAGNSWILTVRQRTNASDLTITPQAAASLLNNWSADLLTPQAQPRKVALGIDEFAYLLNGDLTGQAFLRVQTQLATP